MKVFLVSGSHWRVPGVIVRAADSLLGAQAIALEILNRVRADVELPPIKDFMGFDDGLLEANNLFHDITYSDATADIWIDEVPLEMISEFAAAA
jgi:hypothetical protein